MNRAVTKSSNYQIIKFVFVLLCFLPVKPLLADKGDTAKGKKSPVTHYFTESMVAPGNIWAQYGWDRVLGGIVDTNLQNLQIYTTHYNLGNTGLPCIPLIFNNNLQPLGFYYGKDYISNNFYSDSTVKYFDTRAPYTRFYYVTDPQIHQYFELTHAQNIGKKFNFGIIFKRIRSEGNYLNQSTNLNQLLVSSNYHTKRYSLFTDAIYDVHRFQQNGGIKADTFLASSNYSQRLTVPVNLNFANTTMDEISFHLKQYYFFNRGKEQGVRSKDSLTPYSLSLTPGFYISHSFRIAGHSNVYSDEDTVDAPFYHNFYHDSLTYDSLRYTELTNDISVGYSRKSSVISRKENDSLTHTTYDLRLTTMFGWEAGITQQHIHFQDFVSIPQGEGVNLVLITKKLTDTTVNNYIAHARLYQAFAGGKVLFDASGQYIFSGNLQGNSQEAIMLGIKLDSLHLLKLTGIYSNQAPPFIYDLYQGNNFDWVNHFNNVTTSSAGLNYRDNKWHFDITLQATQITNMVYFDNTAQPMQYAPSIKVYCASITKDFRVFRHFHLNTTEKFQDIPYSLPLTAYSLPLRLPRLVAENSIYYENYLFHHALLLRIGADFWYNTSYYGYAYMPVFDQYYTENSTKLGNYLYIDPFVSFRIKTFRMFLKYENATQGLVPYNYYYALHYPMNDATLRFGISWDFWN